MANPSKRLDSNIAGNFYVDGTCINCDTCRQLAPKTFEEVGEFSAVFSQPEGDDHSHRAYQALLACPVGSIGTEQSEPSRVQAAMASFPLHKAYVARWRELADYGPSRGTAEAKDTLDKNGRDLATTFFG